MNIFIDTSEWPLVHLTMPEQVADEEAESRVREMAALYERAEPFVLIMAGVELPRHSARFMQAYGAWRRESAALQQSLCLGAVRIEPDEALRQAYEARAAQAAKISPPPYPYAAVADRSAAWAIAGQWLAKTGVRLPGWSEA